MPQFVEGPAITADIVARGVPSMTPNGGKEIHFDSSAARMAFDQGGVPVTDPAYVPEIVSAPSPATLAETLPPDVLKAMAKGGTPSAESIRAMIAQSPPQFPSVKIASTLPPSPIQYGAAVELTIPVGNGVTARVTFTQEPARIHWRKLIRHLEIEAEDADESVPTKQPDLVALADAALRRTGSRLVPDTPKTRRRKNAVVEAHPQAPRE